MKFYGSNNYGCSGKNPCDLYEILCGQSLLVNSAHACRNFSYPCDMKLCSPSLVMYLGTNN